MTSGNPHGAPCASATGRPRRVSAPWRIFSFVTTGTFLYAWTIPSCFRGERSRPRPAAPKLMVRRARGFVPEPVRLPERPFVEAGDSVFAAGAELKHTFCLTRGREAFVSQHLGDVSRPENFAFFEETLKHLLRLLEVEPRVVVRDLHPDYLSSRLADDVAASRGLEELMLQHHVAHVCAVMAEHGLSSPVLGLRWTVPASATTARSGRRASARLARKLAASGSFFALCPARRRSGHPFALAHGAGSVARGRTFGQSAVLAASPERARLAPMIDEMLHHGIRCPLTSSCGRLFDAVSALCGRCFDVTYEGQAAIRLEEAQDRQESGAYELPLRERDGLLEADVVALFVQAARDAAEPGRLARRFHRGLRWGWPAGPARRRTLPACSTWRLARRVQQPHPACGTSRRTAPSRSSSAAALRHARRRRFHFSRSGALGDCSSERRRSDAKRADF